MSETAKPWRPPPIKGLVCYYWRFNPDGTIRTVLYRPETGPWTDALKAKVPGCRRGNAEIERMPVMTQDRIPVPSRSVLRTELKSRQGDLGL